MSMRDDRNHPPSEDLFAYRDGELGPEKRALIEAHVMGCSICRSFIDQVSSLEAELRQSPDRAPAEYLERLHESVRARIAASDVAAGAQGALPEEAREEPAAPGGAREIPGRAGEIPGRAGAWRERERRRSWERTGDDDRIRDVPRLPWAAILSTASAAAAVLVVVVILIKQGIYQHAVTPRLPPVAMRAPGGGMNDSTAVAGGAKSDVAARARREAASGSLAREKDLVKQEAERRDAAKLEANAKDQLGERESLDKTRVSQRAPAQGTVTIREEIGENGEPPPAASQGGEEPQKKAANAAPRSLADASNAPGARYDALLGRFGLPPVWDGALVSPGALERAEPELKSLYSSGGAGRDSARVRLYLAEAARLRYAPGDSILYQEIEGHYRRAIELAGSDAETARVAEERLRTLER